MPAQPSPQPSHQPHAHPAALTVAFLTDAPRIAGSEIWLRDLLPLLPAHGIAPTLFLPDHAGLDGFAAQLPGVEVRRYGPGENLAAQTQHFDLRVIQAWEPRSYARWLPALAAPRLVVSHDQLDYHYPAPIRALYRQIFRLTKAQEFRKADGVLTVSAWGAAFLRQRMHLRDVRAMHNGADTTRFQPATPAERAQLRRELGFSRFTVLVPGRFTLEKNQLAAVLTAHFAPELDFVFVGDMDSGFGVLARQLQRLLRLGNVRFLGRRSDMPQLYQAADVLLQPTLAENQSLVTLEAMSSGLPPITTSIPAQTELVQDGISGLCVPPQPDLMARALRALCQHPEQTRQMGKRARKRVLEGFMVEQSAAQLARELYSMAGADTKLQRSTLER